MKLYNTLSKSVQGFEPQYPPKVTIYTCGPTVYDYAHIGHWFTYVRADILIRTLHLAGYDPDWVMNITDVGHLVSDADEGEDKLEKGARREGKTAWEVAEFYTKDFVECLDTLRVQKPKWMPKATDHIPEQIVLVQKLMDKGYGYIIDDGVYYDTSKFVTYADFAQLDLDDQQEGARVTTNTQKRNPSDFALWKFSPKDTQRDMEWWAPWKNPNDSSSEKHEIAARSLHASAPQGAVEQRTESYDAYGEGVAESATQQSAASTSGVTSSAGEQASAVQGSWGFPGWHIECSAMSMKYLGETLDIHTGGIDHVPVHHTNEIAQSEAATGKKFANFWMHSNHVMVNGEKISKSLGNGIRLQEIIEKGFTPDVIRLHILESHYRSQSKFSWEGLEAAKSRLSRWQAIADLRWQVIQPADFLVPYPETTLAFQKIEAEHEHAVVSAKALDDFKKALLNDLDTPKALFATESVMNLIEKDGMTAFIEPSFTKLLQQIHWTLGIDLFKDDITDVQKQLVRERTAARQAKDWAKSDELRDQLKDQGIGLNDTPKGASWFWL